MEVKYFTARLLLDAAVDGWTNGFNRKLAPEGVEKLPQENLYPVVGSIGMDEGVRCQVAINAQGDTFWLDVTYDRFNGLPTTEAGE